MPVTTATPVRPRAALDDAGTPPVAGASAPGAHGTGANAAGVDAARTRGGATLRAAAMAALALLLLAVLAPGGPAAAVPTDAGAARAADTSPRADGSATGPDVEHPSERQPGEEPAEQFGEPADADTERVVRLLRNALGVLVAIVVLLLVIVVPLRGRRRRGRDVPPPSA